MNQQWHEVGLGAVPPAIRAGLGAQPLLYDRHYWVSQPTGFGGVRYMRIGVGAGDSTINVGASNPLLGPAVNTDGGTTTSNTSTSTTQATTDTTTGATSGDQSNTEAPSNPPSTPSTPATPTSPATPSTPAAPLAAPAAATTSSAVPWIIGGAVVAAAGLIGWAALAKSNKSSKRHPHVGAGKGKKKK